jgi:cobalt/nickel transport system permease protein
MRKLLALSFLTIGLWFGCSPSDGKWEGVDKTVVEKMAREAGRPPSKPLINTDRGDLLLFLFLLAGAAGGFIAGYYFRHLFPPRSGKDSHV